jgi:phosphoglycolate phosphatase
VVQTILTGNGRPNATLKLRAFALDGYLDFEVGGYRRHAGQRRPAPGQEAQEIQQVIGVSAG